MSEEDVNQQPSNNNENYQHHNLDHQSLNERDESSSLSAKDKNIESQYDAHDQQGSAIASSSSSEVVTETSKIAEKEELHNIENNERRERFNDNDELIGQSSSSTTNATFLNNEAPSSLRQREQYDDHNQPNTNDSYKKNYNDNRGGDGNRGRDRDYDRRGYNRGRSRDRPHRHRSRSHGRDRERDSYLSSSLSSRADIIKITNAAQEFGYNDPIATISGIEKGANPAELCRFHDSISYALSIPSIGVKSIVGDRGIIIHQIMDQTGSHVFIQSKEDSNQSTRRTIRFEGLWPQVVEAQRRVLDILWTKGDKTSADLSEETLVMIPTADTAALIGHKGEVVRDIENATNTTIKIYRPEGGHEARHALVIVRGKSGFGPDEDPQRIIQNDKKMQEDEILISLGKKAKPMKRKQEEERAVEEIRKLLRIRNLVSDIPSVNDRHAYLEVPVPSRFSGSIVGQKASVVRQMENQSGARIRLSREGIKYTTPTEVMRYVSVEGNGQSVRAAYWLIIEQIQDAIDRSMNGLKGIDTYEIPLTVPDNLIAVIVGKGGRALHDLQDLTQTKIHVEHASRGDRGNGTRLVEIRGRMDDAEAAQRMIVDRLIDASTKTYDSKRNFHNNESRDDYYNRMYHQSDWQLPGGYTPQNQPQMRRRDEGYSSHRDRHNDRRGDRSDYPPRDYRGNTWQQQGPPPIMHNSNSGPPNTYMGAPPIYPYPPSQAPPPPYPGAEQPGYPYFDPSRQQPPQNYTQGYGNDQYYRQPPPYGMEGPNQTGHWGSQSSYGYNQQPPPPYHGERGYPSHPGPGYPGQHQPPPPQMSSEQIGLSVDQVRMLSDFAHSLPQSYYDPNQHKQ